MVGKKEVKPVAVLVITCMVWGAILGLVHQATEHRIEKAEQVEIHRILLQIFPSSEFREENGYYVCLKEGKVEGYVILVKERGYGGKMKVGVGVIPGGTVKGVRILSHGETPGLGARIEEESFLAQFEGKDLEGLRLKEDGGEIEAITGATISSRAVIRAVRIGLENLLGVMG